MKRFESKLVLLLVPVLVFAVFVSTGLAAGKYPTKPITAIDPWPPGGGVDIVGRMLGSVAAEYLGQPLILKYISGAAGVRGAEAVSRAKPDGYTIGLFTMGAIINTPTSQPETAPFGKDSFVWIAQFTASPCVLVAHPKAPFKTLPEMIKYVKANPGKIVYSSSGRFGFVHVAFARLIQAEGLKGKMVHLPTKGGAGAVKEALGGHTMATGGTPGVTSPHIRGGTLIPMAVCDTKRWPTLPDIPTLKEVLGKDITPTKLWVSACVPKGTPKDRIQFLREGFAKMAQNKSVVKMAIRIGDRIEYLSGPDMQKKWENEWKEAKGLLPILMEK
jgi:tripartite-type tricarboxylate transporter receptor subunit TctC